MSRNFFLLFTTLYRVSTKAHVYNLIRVKLKKKFTRVQLTTDDKELILYRLDLVFLKIFRRQDFFQSCYKKKKKCY